MMQQQHIGFILVMCSLLTLEVQSNSNNISQEVEFAESMDQTYEDESNASIQSSKCSKDIFMSTLIEEEEDDDPAASIQLSFHLPMELTGFYKRFRYECPPGSALFRIFSVFNGADRGWYFKCRKISRKYFSNCRWTESNMYEKPFVANCERGYAVTGIKSSAYSKVYKDRKYSILCCKTDELKNTCCADTSYRNRFTKVLQYSAPKVAVITGISSKFNRKRKDRRFKVRICQSKHQYHDCQC